MRASIFFVFALTTAVLLTAAVTADGERVNKSAAPASLYSSTENEEGEHLRKLGDDESGAAATLLDEKDEFDGGFSSLDAMLQWAIGHSDPAKLKETAQDIQHLSPEEIKKRQIEVKELMEKLKTPSDAQLMQIAIDDLNNVSLSLEDRHRALQELLILVEPIDNANDLNKLGGLAAVIRELSNPDLSIRVTSAWILGKASQNNPIVQKQVLEFGALTRLIEMAKSSFVEEALKAVYAISALIRNNLHGQELFYAGEGDLMLEDILSNSSSDLRLCKKSVFLVADLVESQLEKKTEFPVFSNHFFLKAVVNLMASTDLDLQEKALYAIKNLLQLRSTEAQVFMDFCGLSGALERMKHQLQQLMVEEDHREYAMDVESLRRDVELIFLRKLDQVEQVLST